jgi:putative toxin-antitoxin system antitoxin component (TIGR02293 family)
MATSRVSTAPRPSAHAWLETLGRLVRRPLQSEADVLTLVEAGVRGSTYARIATHLQLPQDAIGAATTIRNRLKSQLRLHPDETERLVRIIRVYALALQHFGCETIARSWLHKPA